MVEFKVTINTPDLTKAVYSLSEAVKTLALAIGLKNDTANEDSQLAEIPTVPCEVTSESAIERNVFPAPPTPTPAETAPPTQATSPVQTVPTSAPQYTLEMLAKAGTALVDAGKINELMALLTRYGVDALTSLDPSQYGSVAMDLRNLGAQI